MIILLGVLNIKTLISNKELPGAMSVEYFSLEVFISLLSRFLIIGESSELPHNLLLLLLLLLLLSKYTVLYSPPLKNTCLKNL